MSRSPHVTYTSPRPKRDALAGIAVPRTRAAKCTQFITTLTDFEMLLLQITSGFMPEVVFDFPTVRSHFSILRMIHCCCSGCKLVLRWKRKHMCTYQQHPTVSIAFGTSIMEKSTENHQKIIQKSIKIDPERHLEAVLGGLGRSWGSKGEPVLQKTPFFCEIPPKLGAKLEPFSVIFAVF